jgi:hypothetical protein
MLYSQLHHSITDNQTTHKKITKILEALSKKMPERAVNQAKRVLY